MVLKTTLAAAFTTSGVRGIAIFWEISKDLLTIKMEVEEVRLCVTSWRNLRNTVENQHFAAVWWVCHICLPLTSWFGWALPFLFLSV